MQHLTLEFQTLSKLRRGSCLDCLDLHYALFETSAASGCCFRLPTSHPTSLSRWMLVFTARPGEGISKTPQFTPQVSVTGRGERVAASRADASSPILPLVSARGQAADGSMGPDLSTPNSRRPALDYRPEVGGVAMSRSSTLPPPPDRVQSSFEPTHGKLTKIALQATPGEQRPPDRRAPPPLPATGSPGSRSRSLSRNATSSDGSEPPQHYLPAHHRWNPYSKADTFSWFDRVSVLEKGVNVITCGIAKNGITLRKRIVAEVLGQEFEQYPSNPSK
eukprot:scaffold65894_cov56-Phaeocystis_antarctica.AAC.1